MGFVNYPWGTSRYRVLNQAPIVVRLRVHLLLFEVQVTNFHSIPEERILSELGWIMFVDEIQPFLQQLFLFGKTEE